MNKASPHILFAWIFCSSSFVFASGGWDLQGIDAAINLPRVEKRLQTLVANPTPQLVIGQLIESPAYNLPEKEWLLWQLAKALAKKPETADRSEAIQILKAYQPEVLVPHQESASHLVPRFSIRSSAAGAENAWIGNRAYDRARRLIESADVSIFSEFSIANGAEKNGIYRAISSAEFVLLDVIKAKLVFETHLPSASGLVLAMAERLDSAPLYFALADYADATTISKMARHLSGSTDKKTAVEVLMRAAQRDAVRSVVLVDLIKLSDGRQETHAYVAGLLGDQKSGASAALALSRLPGKALATVIARQAKSGVSDLAMQRMRLSLSLNNTPESKHLLKSGVIVTAAEGIKR